MKRKPLKPGRKALPYDEKKRQVCLYLRGKTLAKLDAMAAAEGLDRSAFVVALMARGVEERNA